MEESLFKKGGLHDEPTTPKPNIIPVAQNGNCLTCLTDDDIAVMKVENCPQCGSEKHIVVKNDFCVIVCCSECFYLTSTCKTRAEAINIWNKDYHENFRNNIISLFGLKSRVETLEREVKDLQTTNKYLKDEIDIYRGRRKRNGSESN